MKVKWARHVRPGAPMGGIVAPQRVESIFTEVKRLLGRLSSLREVLQGLSQLERTLMVESERQAICITLAYHWFPRCYHK